MRADIAEATSQTPVVVQRQLADQCTAALSLLNDHLPAEEKVTHISSAAARWMNGTINSILALTTKRLLFVAPAPQVVSFRLPEIDSTQATSGSGEVGIFHLSAGDSKFQLGIAVQYGDAFAEQVCRAVAIARLADF